MASTASYATTENCTNLLGPLFVSGANQTPFLTAIGGLGGINSRTAKGWAFPIAQLTALDAGAQPAVTEDASVTGPPLHTYARSQAFNTCQIFHQGVQVSYAKEADLNTLAGIPILGESTNIPSEKQQQIAMNLKQIALDAEVAFLTGTYVAAGDANVAAKTRGIITAVATDATNTTAVSGALTKAALNGLAKKMADSGAQFGKMQIHCGSFVKQALTTLYSYVPMDRKTGGGTVDTLETDFFEAEIVFNPHITAGTLLVADISVCHPVFLPVPGKGTVFYEELAKTGASESGQIYGQIGLDYGPVLYHGTLTSLTSS
jgi:hypothetical protein